MKNVYLILLLPLFLMACKQPQTPSEVVDNVVSLTKEKPDLFYHYSIWYAFVNKIFEGNLTAKELKTKGDIGLGSYNLLDGELIMLDGILYQATEDGKVIKAPDDAKIVYANATFFDEDQSFKIDKAENYASLREQINTELPSRNIFYGFKIHGDFKKINDLFSKEKISQERWSDFFVLNLLEILMWQLITYISFLMTSNSPDMLWNSKQKI